LVLPAVSQWLANISSTVIRLNITSRRVPCASIVSEFHERSNNRCGADIDRRSSKAAAAAPNESFVYQRDYYAQLVTPTRLRERIFFKRST